MIITVGCIGFTRCTGPAIDVKIVSTVLLIINNEAQGIEQK